MASRGLGRDIAPHLWTVLPAFGFGLIVGRSTDLVNVAATKGLRGFVVGLIAAGLWFAVLIAIGAVRGKRFERNELPWFFTTIGDKDAPHLKLKVIVVNTQFVAYPDESGKFEIANMPAGNYKLKIWYGDKWIERPDDSVEVKDKGKTEFNPKIEASAFAPAGKK